MANKRKPRILMMNEASFLATGYSTYGMEVQRRLYDTGLYEIAELACYGQATDTRREELPWGYYPNMPSDFNSSEWTAYNADNVNQFGQWKFNDVCLQFKPDIVWDIRDWWMCLKSGTPIVTMQGVKNVEDITTLDTVLTHKGNYRPVNRIFTRRYTGFMNKIVAHGCNIPIEITDGHPVLGKKRKYGEGVILPKFSDLTPEWIPSEQIDKGDFVCVPIINQISLDSVHSVNMARLIGYYAAEGCIMYEGRKEKGIIKGAQWTLNASETDYINDIVAIVYTEFDVRPIVKIKGNTAVIRVFSKKVGDFFNHYVPGLAGSKSMKPSLMQSPLDIQRSILCGLFRGDGGYYGNRATYCTKSRTLAFQVFHLCARLGVFGTFCHANNSIRKRNKKYRRFLFSFNDTNVVAFKDIYDNTWSPLPQSKRIANGYVWLTVKSKERYQDELYVYNFEVLGDNSYTSVFGLHNCEHVERSPFRRFFKWCIMPTVDAYPQNEQWISTYINADSVFTYTDWGQEVLRREGGGLINLRGTASPGADLVTFRPMDRAVLRQRFGFESDVFIVGTVMRNQPRKLYDDLIEAFAEFVGTAPPELARKTFLYLHTTYPDQGWDIPCLIKQSGIGHKIIVTYRCRNTNCHLIFPSFYQDARAACPKCGYGSAALPNVSVGVDREALAQIINLFDIYVQYANSEGFGMPQVEAASCGVPVIAIDYSAMSDIVEKVEGFPVKVLKLRKDHEFGCYRAIPDNSDFVKILIKFLSLSDEKRKELGMRARKGVESNYTWDKAVQKWMGVFDSFPLPPLDQTWQSPARIHIPKPVPSLFPSNEALVEWAMENVLGRPDLKNSYMALRLIRDLNWGVSMAGTGGTYQNENCMIGIKNNLKEFSENDVIRNLTEICEINNEWERRRCHIHSV